MGFVQVNSAKAYKLSALEIQIRLMSKKVNQIETIIFGNHKNLLAINEKLYCKFEF